MKKSKQLLLTVLIASLLVLIASSVSGQVQIDKPLQLTGSGLDARVMGIDAVADAKDGVSLEYLQSGAANYAISTGTGNNYVIELPYFSGSPVEGMVVIMKANHNSISGEVTLTLNNNTKQIVSILPYGGIDFPIVSANRIYLISFDGDNWQMIGEDWNL